MLVSITAMMVGMTKNSVPPTFMEIIVFGVFNLVALANIIFAVRSVKPCRLCTDAQGITG